MHALTPVYAALTILSFRSFGADRVRPARSVPLVACASSLRSPRYRSAHRSSVRVNRYEEKISSWAAEFPAWAKVGRSGRASVLRRTAFGGVFNPEASASRVLLIDGPRGERHLRALAFDTYEDHRWRPVLTTGSLHASTPTRCWPPVGRRDRGRGCAHPTAQTSEVMRCRWRPVQIEPSQRSRLNASGSLRASESDDAPRRRMTRPC